MEIGKDGTVYHGPWPKGMNNRQPSHSLPDGAARNAVDVDFDNMGEARTRLGFTKVASGIDLRDGFSCEAGIFVVEAGALCRVEADWSRTPLVPGVKEPCAFEYFNGTVYFSDGNKTKKITGDSVTNWGMAVPPAPVIYGSTGNMAGGEYLGAITYVDASGNESGASGTDICVTEGSIVFTNIPQPDDPQIVGVRFYLSHANGTTLYQVGEMPVGAPTFTAYADGDVELMTQFCTPPPAGRIIRQFNGRLFIAEGNILWHTDEYSMDLIQPGANFYQYPAPITIVEPVPGGIWVVADKTYFLFGNGPEDFGSRTALEYGAVFGTGRKIPNSKDVAWFSTRGLVIAGAGEIKNVMEEQCAPDQGDSGSLLIREENGIRQAVTTIQNPTLPPIVAKSFMEAEIIRRA